MTKKNDSGYSTAVKITCIVLVALTIVGVAATIAVYLFV